MIWVDLKKTEALNNIHKNLGADGLKLLKFNQADYINNHIDTENSLAHRAMNKIAELGVQETFADVYMLGQLRCLGVYFSPVNFYFYKCKQGKFTHMVAEVSNTPWNERHYYLVPLEKKVNFKKDFSVSPFMNLDMDYHWHVRMSASNIMIHIENKKQDELLFDATLRLQRRELDKENITQLLRTFPVMTWSIFKGIYIHAFKLFCKRVPFIGHSGKGD